MVHFKMQTFDKAVASKYSIPKEDKDPAVINGVTIVADEVGVRQIDTKQWKTFCSTSPASVIQTYSQDSMHHFYRVLRFQRRPFAFIRNAILQMLACSTFQS